MDGRDYVVQHSGAKTRAKRKGACECRLPSAPGSVRTECTSTRQEAGGSIRHRRPEQTLERRKPMRDVVCGRGLERPARTDAAGGSNPLKRPIAGCEGAAFGCQRGARGSWKVLSLRSGGSSGGSTPRWKPQEGKAGREASPLPGDGSSEGRIPGALRARSARKPGVPRGWVRSNAPRTLGTSKAQWAGVGIPARDDRAFGPGIGPDASPIQDALKGDGTPWEVARGARSRDGADVPPRSRRPSRVMR